MGAGGWRFRWLPGRQTAHYSPRYKAPPRNRPPPIFFAPTAPPHHLRPSLWLPWFFFSCRAPRRSVRRQAFVKPFTKSASLTRRVLTTVFNSPVTYSSRSSRSRPSFSAAVLAAFRAALGWPRRTPKGAAAAVLPRRAAVLPRYRIAFSRGAKSFARRRCRLPRGAYPYLNRGRKGPRAVSAEAAHPPTPMR